MREQIEMLGCLKVYKACSNDPLAELESSLLVRKWLGADMEYPLEVVQVY